MQLANMQLPYAVPADPPPRQEITDLKPMSHSHRSPLDTLQPIRPAVLVVLLLLAAAQTVFARPLDCEARAVRDHLSIPVRDLESWEPVDSRTLLIWSPANARAHLIRLDSWIGSLPSAATLTLIDGDRDGLITACGHDRIRVIGGMARILSIEYLSAKRTAELDRKGWNTPLEARLGLSVRRALLGRGAGVRQLPGASRATRSADPAPAAAAA